MKTITMDNNTITELDNGFYQFSLGQQANWITSDISYIAELTLENYCYNLFEKFFSTKVSTGCDHDWKIYVGFTKTDQYCTKCNEKKELSY